MTATTTVTVPSAEQLARSLSALSAAERAVADVSFAVSKVAGFEGTETPTYDDLGRAFAWTIEAKAYVDELERYIAVVTDELENLDYVRECGNVDPDGCTCSVCGREAVSRVANREGWEWRPDKAGDFTCVCGDCRAGARDA